MQYLSRGSTSKFALINLFCLFWCNLQVIFDRLSYIGSESTHNNLYKNLRLRTIDSYAYISIALLDLNC